MISGTPRAKLPSSGAEVSRVNSGIAMPSFFDPPWVTLRKTSTPWECEGVGRRQHASHQPRRGLRQRAPNRRGVITQPLSRPELETEMHAQRRALNSGGSGGNGLASMIARTAD